MRFPVADSGDVRTSLRHEPISKHRHIPNDPGPLWPDQTKRTLTSLLCPQDIPGWARGTCDASANASASKRGAKRSGDIGGLTPGFACVFWG